MNDREAVKAAILNIPNNNILIELPTGHGKTAIALEILKTKLQKGNILVVVPRLVLKKNFMLEVKKWWKDCPLTFTLTTYRSLHKYTGNWTVISSGDTVVVPGTIEIAATDSAYTANFTFTSEQFSINVGGKDQTTKLNATSVANIAFAGASGKSFDYSNSSNTNPMGTSFAGKIFEGNITSLFTLQQKVGRKKYEFSYRFVGQRQ